MAWKTRGARFETPGNQWGIKDLAEKVSGLDRNEAPSVSTALLLDRREANISREAGYTAWKDRSVKCMGTQWEGYVLISERIPEKKHSWRDSSRKKGTGQSHLSPVPEHKHRAPCRNQNSTDTNYLTYLYQAPPPHPPLVPQMKGPLILFCLSPSHVGPPPRRPALVVSSPRRSLWQQ